VNIVTVASFRSIVVSAVGICAMCGKKILETKNYRQSSV